MEDRFCCLWIPCVIHEFPHVIPEYSTFHYPGISSCERIQPLYNISEQGFYDIHTRVDVNGEEDSSIKIRVKIRAFLYKDERKPVIREAFRIATILKSVEIRRCGLIQFKYSLSKTDHDRLKGIKDTLYHHIKVHFHHHLNHIDSESILRGCFTDERIDLRQPDNYALRHYFHEIHNYLNAKADFLLDDFKFIEGHVDKDDPEHKEGRRLFYQNCENLLGMTVFFNSLLNSKRNHSCRIVPLSSECDDELRRLGANIHNLIEAIRSIYRKSQSAFYLLNIQENREAMLRAEKSEKLSKWLGWVSIGLGLLSLGLTIWQSCENRSTIKQIETNQEIESLNPPLQELQLQELQPPSPRAPKPVK